MTESAATEAPHNVPAKIFEEFIKKLASAGAPTELVSRLRKTLLEDKTFTERALQEAVFAEEPLT